MTGECPRCGLKFEREEGYWLGAIIINTLNITVYTIGIPSNVTLVFKAVVVVVLCLSQSAAFRAWASTWFTGLRRRSAKSEISEGAAA